MLKVATPETEHPAPPQRAPGDALADALAATLDTVGAAAADPDPVAMVHDARKAMKQYRALLRLVPGEAAKAERRRAAAVARQMSGSRDRVAALDALAHMEKEGVVLACDLADARTALGQDGDEGRDAAGHRDALADFVAAARAALGDELAGKALTADVPAGLAKAYRQARRSAFDTPEAMHEARKRVVAHRYQMSFVADAFGHGAKRARRTQKLRDLFGAFQDIETLRPLLGEAGADLPEGTRERLTLAMDRAQKRLRKRAVEAHKALFRVSAKDFRAHCRDVTGAPPN